MHEEHALPDALFEHEWSMPAKAQAPRTFPDHFWRDAFAYAYKVRGGGLVAAHETCNLRNSVRFREYDSGRNVSVVVLHKDYISYVPLGLQTKMRDWFVVFSNDVFSVVSTKYNQDGEIGPELLSERSRHKKHRESLSSKKLAFVHVPKCAGTSVVHALTRGFQSSVYANTRTEFLNDVHLDQFRMISGHIYLGDLIAAEWLDYPVIATVRDPMERFVSAVAHARRADEEVEALSPMVSAMRSLRLMDVVNEAFFLQEASVFSVFFGHKPAAPTSDMEKMRGRAINSVSEGLIRLFGVDEIQRLASFCKDKWNVELEFSKRNQTEDPFRLFAKEEIDFLHSDEFKQRFAEEKQFLEHIKNMDP